MHAAREQNRAFPTTHWSLVADAGANDRVLAANALGQLLTRYIPALRAHLVGIKRVDEHKAEDLLQSFLSVKFLEQNLAAEATRDKGKFRTFVLTALDRFVVSEGRRESAIKRTAERAESLHQDGFAGTIVDTGADPCVFELEWARQLLREVVRRVETECRNSGRLDVWGVFELRLLKPIFEDSPAPDYSALIERFGFRSPTQASNVLVTAKRMFQRRLREAVGEYALTAEQIDDEIRDLRRALGSHG